MTDKEVAFVVNAINQVSENYQEWGKAYRFDPACGDFTHNDLQVQYPDLANFEPLAVQNSAPAKNSIMQRLFG